MTTAVVAQKRGDVELGVNLGFNKSSVSNDKNQSDQGAGFNFAGSVDYYFSNRWSLKGKLIYDQKGWDNDVIQDSNTGYYYPTNFNVNYLTVPVMANWHFGKTRNWYLDFGPYIGFLLNAKDTHYGTNVTNAFNTTDFGLSLGIGVKIPVSDKIKIFIEMDGQGGATNIIKDNPYSAITNSRSSLNFGMNFLLK
jgi:hypothetical protein